MVPRNRREYAAKMTVLETSRRVFPYTYRSARATPLVVEVVLILVELGSRGCAAWRVM